MENKKIKFIKNKIIFIIGIFVLYILCVNNIYAKSDVRSEGISQFPSTYQAQLNQLKAKYPNWKFVAVYTNLNWEDVIKGQSVNGRSLVPISRPSAWKRSDIQIESGWVNASDNAIGYCLDPRNFLNEKDIFQFEKTSYNGNINNIAAVNQVLLSTPMMDSSLKYKYKNNGIWLDLGLSYTQAICNIGKNNNVSPIHLASRIKQETSGDIINNKSIYGSYPGYEGYYNFFNIAATGSNPVLQGLIHAKNNNWNNPIESIHSGAYKINKDYTCWGQDTIYFEKWDVNDITGGQSMYWHQYMTNILAPTSESTNKYLAYKNSNLLNEPFEFRIPIYNLMSPSAFQIVNSYLNIDAPLNNTVVKEVDLNVYGWILSDSKNSTVKISVDGKEIKDSIARLERADVLKAVSGYGGINTNPKPGFYTSINTTGLTKGTHTLSIEILDGNGNSVKKQERTFIIDRPDTILNIDAPQTNSSYKKEINLYGWYLSEDAGSKINLYVNNKLITPNIGRTARADVLNAISGYGGLATNPKPRISSKY